MFQKNTTGSYFYSKENSIINEAIEHLDDILSECEKHEQKTKRLNELVKNNAEYKEELELINKKIYTYQNIHSGEEVRRIEDKVKLKFADVNYPDLTYVDVAYDIVNGIPGFDKNRIINTANVIEKKYKELLENNSKLNKALEEVIEGKYRRTSEYLELISEKNDYEKKLKNYSAFDFDKTPDYVELEKKCEKLSKQFSEIQIKGAKLEQKKQDIEEKLLPKKTTIQNYMSKNFFENTKTNRSKITPYIPLGFSLDKDIDVHKINYIKHDFKPCIIKYNDSMIENDGLVNFIANAIFGVVINDVDQNKLYKVELIDTSGRLIQISNTQSIKRLVAGNYLEYVKDSSSATMLLKALNKERSELGMSLEDHNEICIEKHRENNIKPYVLLIINENLGNINSWRDTFVQIVNNSEYWGIIPIIFTSNSEYDERIFLEVFKNTINFIELDSFVRANNHDEMRLILEDINFTVENYKF